MKQLLSISMVIAVFALSSCSDNKRPAQRVSGNRDMARGAPANTIGGGPGASTNQAGSDPHWGKFYADVNTNFADQIKLFFSTGLDPASIGDINPDINGTDTGVWFWGQVTLQGGTLRNLVTSGQSLSVGSNSRMEVRVYDSYAVSGQQQYISAGFSDNVSGTVTPNGSGGFTVDLIFRDTHGYIHLNGGIYSSDGTLQTSIFQGNAAFTNNCSFNPDTGQCDGASQAGGEQPMGSFQVDACHFFSCQ